ncbi:MAG: type IV pilus modification PilV family protein [Opitutales bacterium]
MNPPRNPSSARRGFSLVEVTLAIGIVGVAILSLVGILGSTFQQVDEIMQTNRALAGVTRLIGALDNPRSIVYLDAAGEKVPDNTKYLMDAGLSLDGGNPSVSGFDIAYRLLQKARDNGDNAVWLYVYERKIVAAENDKTGDTTYALFSNPSIVEVAYCNGNNLSLEAFTGRNIVGTPMRVRLSLSKLLVGQRATINTTTLEPDISKVPAPPWSVSPLPAQPSAYALAYLPVVAEFFPHDYSPYASFKTRTEEPLLVQNIVISR